MLSSPGPAAAPAVVRPAGDLLDRLVGTLSGNVQLRTAAYAVLGLMGPRSRELLATLTDSDLSTAAFPFMSFRRIVIAYVL